MKRCLGVVPIFFTLEVSSWKLFSTKYIVKTFLIILTSYQLQQIFYSSLSLAVVVITDDDNKWFSVHFGSWMWLFLSYSREAFMSLIFKSSTVDYTKYILIMTTSRGMLYLKQLSRQMPQQRRNRSVGGVDTQMQPLRSSSVKQLQVSGGRFSVRYCVSI